MTETIAPLSLRVAEARLLNPLIRMFRFQAPDGGVLPPWEPGSHIKVRVTLPDGSRDWRHYSLIDLVGDGSRTGEPRDYLIAVRREDGGRGGSLFMHQVLAEGDRIEIQPPKNDFPLHDGHPGALLIAGGIGITPMASMASRRHRSGEPVRLCYAGRSRDLMAFLPELQSLLGEGLAVHADVEAGGPLDLEALLDSCGADEKVYVCGPKVMLDALLAAVEARGWPRDRVHFELFLSHAPAAGDRPFEVGIAGTDETFTVPADKSILDCLIDQGRDPMFDCKRGECGVCTTAVVAGEVDHRDYFLSKAEKASGKVMQICISRARGDRLVLDLDPAAASAAIQAVRAGKAGQPGQPTRASQPAATARPAATAKPAVVKKPRPGVVRPITVGGNNRRVPMFRYQDNPEAIRALVRDREVHKDLFIDEEVFRLEMEHLFASTWVYVGHASQVPKVGDFYTTTVGDQPVMMVRHTDQSIRVIHNRCPHKGVQVCAEPLGNTGKFFRCPYHAWTFRTDGSLLSIPLSRGYDDVGLDQCEASGGMAAVGAVEVYRDFVFCRLKPDGIGFEDFFGESLTTLDNMVDRSPEGRLEVAGGVMRYLHHCNWKMLVDNQTDTCHPMVAHESSAGTAVKVWQSAPPGTPKPMAVELFAPFVNPYEFFENMGIRVWPNGHGHTGVSDSIHAAYSPIPGYHEAMVRTYGEERTQQILSDVRHNTVYFPNIMVKGPIQTLRLFKPIAANKTLVESFTFRLVGAPDLLFERTLMYNRLVNAPTSVVGHDDLEMYERAQMALHSRALDWVNVARLYDPAELSQSTAVTNGTNEWQMRSQYRNWARFMADSMADSMADRLEG